MPRVCDDETGARMTGRVGVLVMAHGTPQRTEDIAPFYTRIRRGRPPTPEQLADLERRYAAIGGLSPLTERAPRPRWTPCAPSWSGALPAATSWPTGPSTPIPSSKRAPPS